MINWYENQSDKLNDTLVEFEELHFKVKNYIYGKSYTYFNPDKKLSGKFHEGKLLFHIHSNISVYIFIHDPNYFFGTYHPMIFPGFIKKFEVKNYNKFEILI